MVKQITSTTMQTLADSVSDETEVIKLLVVILLIISVLLILAFETIRRLVAKYRQAVNPRTFPRRQNRSG